PARRARPTISLFERASAFAPGWRPRLSHRASASAPRSQSRLAVAALRHRPQVNDDSHSARFWKMDADATQRVSSVRAHRPRTTTIFSSFANFFASVPRGTLSPCHGLRYIGSGRVSLSEGTDFRAGDGLPIRLQPPKTWRASSRLRTKKVVSA